MGIGQNIKEIRKSKGMTQKQLGDLLGVTQAAIGQFESDRSNLTLETIDKIATALNVDPYSLYSFEMASEALQKNINNVQKENTLLNYYNELNATGQNKAIEQVEMLTKIPEYQKATPQNNVHLPDAAHERKGMNFTPEDRRADENMINED